MSYRFIRYKFYNETTDWMFKPETFQDVLDFNEKYTKEICLNGFKNICKSVEETSAWKCCSDEKKYFFGSHPTTHYGQAFYTLMHSPNSGNSIVDVADNLYNMCTNTRVEFFNKGYKFVMSENGLTTVIFDEENSEIVEEKFTDELVFPFIVKPSIKDVRFIQWDGGKHWYAKLGKDDIVVDGNQKWNSYREAEDAAYKYIKSLKSNLL